MRRLPATSRARVETEFPDAELNALAQSVNDLVETVDRGIGETGEVLSALAETDLTQRVTGALSGRFDKLKTDTNAVADKLVEIVAQLKQTSRGVKTATGEILSGANDSERTHHQAGGDDRGDARRDGAAGPYGDGERQAGRRRPASRPRRPRTPPKRAAR